jgi:uncharacterized protein with GYD domain
MSATFGNVPQSLIAEMGECVEEDVHVPRCAPDPPLRKALRRRMLSSVGDTHHLAPENRMPKFLMEASYTMEGAKGLASEGGSSRRKTVEETVKGLRGTLEAFYYAFGSSDVILIVDLQDAVTAAAVSLAINQTGAVRLKSTVLMTAEEMDQAAKKAVSYRAPGK